MRPSCFIPTPTPELAISASFRLPVRGFRRHRKSFCLRSLYALLKDMTSVLSSHPRKLPWQIYKSSLKSRSIKVQCLRFLSVEFPHGQTLSAQDQYFTSYHKRTPHPRQVFVRAVSDDAESSSDGDESKDEESGEEEEEVSGGLSREDLERIVGKDDSTFSGIDLATLIRKKYGRSYDVQLIKKEFMGRNLLAMNVMWKYMEQRSFPLTEEEYLLRLDDVANTLKCWGAVAHIRNSLAKLKERPRIGKGMFLQHNHMSLLN
ncbi:uncharacterized protein LOC103717197 isoform X3 [Phoenix dactylifera]|uniref:Uncharacterized protein LOC103717197 isoform X3 n=1 Tax=Phoenix dactylifera TaxID=42345 RepID=A0A8B8JAA1_PHODC|nr:uncharacterized protein LOC103717197 isoform X3 [Phoenix dactylifera]